MTADRPRCQRCNTTAHYNPTEPLCAPCQRDLWRQNHPNQQPKDEQ